MFSLGHIQMPTIAVFYGKLLLRAKSVLDFTEFKLKKCLCNWKAEAVFVYGFLLVSGCWCRERETAPLKGASRKFNYLIAVSIITTTKTTLKPCVITAVKPTATPLLLYLIFKYIPPSISVMSWTINCAITVTGQLQHTAELAMVHPWLFSLKC